MRKHTLASEQVHDAAWGRERYPHPLVSLLMPVITLLVVIVLGLLGFTVWQKTLPGNVNIPAIQGAPLDEAQRRLRSARLDYEVAKERQSSETVPAGAVLASIPPEGRIVKEGRVIHLLVSSGSIYTKVPDVVNQPQSIARKMLAQAALRVSRETSKYDEEIPVDSVIEISPKPGTKLTKDSEVKLILSRGSRIEIESGVTGNDGTRTAAVIVNVPMNAVEPAEVRIDVTDDNGTRTVYRETHQPGDTIVENIEGLGETTAKAYFGNRLILTRQL